MKRALGIIIGAIGWLLSPLTLWNDPFVNIPIAYIIAVPFKGISGDSFQIAMIIAYWFTNVLGFMLMRIGFSLGLKKRAISKKTMLFDLGASILVSIVLTILLHLGVITSPQL